jgi:hypothetical protein
MILRPSTTQIASSNPALLITPVQKTSSAGVAHTRVRINLQIKRLNVDGLLPSEKGIFLTAFHARLNSLAQDAVQKALLSGLVQRRRATVPRIDGGVTPAGLDAKGMGERAASEILRELLR